MKHASTLLLCALALSLCAQKDSIWLTTGTVSALISPHSGTLLKEFRIPAGDSSVSATKEVSLWMVGTDPAGNLMLAIQKNDAAPQHFEPGFRGVPNSDKVWKVTRPQILQHQQDYADNAFVDNPIPEIFAWPGPQNPFSLIYNGFDISDVPYHMAAPSTTSDEGYFFPMDGHFPLLNSYNNNQRQPDEIAFMPFHEVIANPADPFHPPLGVDVSAVFFTWYCDDAMFLDNTVFCYLNFRFPFLVENDRIESLMAGVLVDGNIGNPDDDYLGTSGRTTYFYNSLPENQPIIGFDLIVTLVNELGINTLPRVMPFFNPSSQLPALLTLPATPVETYYCLSGMWRDGAPLTYGGNGYGGTEVVQVPFTGNPTIPGEWSELDAQNPLTDRVALISSGPGTIASPFDINSVMFALNHVPNSLDFATQIDTLRSYSGDYFKFFWADFFPPTPDPYDALSCFTTTRTSVEPEQEKVKIAPNPANLECRIRSESSMQLIHLELVNLLGQRVLPKYTQVSEHEIFLETTSLAAGIYLLRGRAWDGDTFSEKLVVAH